MVKVEFEVTSEHPCQIPGLGTFEGGDTIKVTPFLQANFRAHNNVSLTDARFAPSVKLRAILVEVDEDEHGEGVTV